MNRRYSIVAGAIAALYATMMEPTAIRAHHGVSGQFDLSQTFTVTGTVNRVRFVNPHSYVYFEVPNDAGEVEQWRCELRSGSLLKRKGWTTDLFPIGSEISIFGSPDRRDPKTCFVETITFESRDVLVRYGEIAEDGSFINPEPDENATEDRAAADPASNAGGEAADVPDIAGNWSEPVADGPPLPYAGRAPDYVLTQAAIEAGDDWAPEDNPRFHCKPTNIILDYRFDQMINKIEQSDTELTISYGFMDVIRTIHLDGEMPETVEPSVTGYSVGTWNDGKLEVVTRGFTSGFLEAIGGRSTRSVPHSDQMEIAETFYIDEAGELVREYTINDPVYLAEPHSHLHKSVKTEDDFIPYDCDDLTVEN